MHRHRVLACACQQSVRCARWHIGRHGAHSGCGVFVRHRCADLHVVLLSILLLLSLSVPATIISWQGARAAPHQTLPGLRGGRARHCLGRKRCLLCAVLHSALLAQSECAESAVADVAEFDACVAHSDA